MDRDYKDTLNLPQTAFPMKANLPEREKEILSYWQEIDIYRKVREARTGAPKYILHDGPPYANGDVHLGTAFNKVLKDIIVKYKLMCGYDTPYVPGWDCHGMPIEHQVVKELQERKEKVSSIKLRELCRQYAEKYVNIQRSQFQRLGVIGDWQNPYLTMNPAYQAKILETFVELFKRGYIYQGLKPIHWCIECKTALAEAELEYADKVSPSIYVKFQLLDNFLSYSPVYVLIWTTTPWTLPANLAISFHPKEKYAVVKVEEDYYIIANTLVKTVLETAKIEDYSVVTTVDGSSFENKRCRHPLYSDKTSLCVLDEQVKIDTGTGCVHIAPGHGEEDYHIGLRYQLPIFSPVDDSGLFTNEAGIWAGLNVFAANSSIIEELKKNNNLFYETTIVHSYPHCWRCKNPLIFRATRQWFLDVAHNKLREKALEAIEKVNWIPAWGQDKIRNLIANRPDWCLSRQRVWGVPIPALYCLTCQEPFIPLEFISNIIKRAEKEGVDFWFTTPEDELVPPGIKCPKCSGTKFKKEKDILDVWFDSGVSFNAVLKQRAELNYPADLYLEATDQHRGWFQVSLLPAIAIENRPPYKAVLTHGLILDEAGKKMSKSAGNVISPLELIDVYGADVLRLWFSSVDYTSDVKLGVKVLEPLVEAYKKIRNTCRFLLGNIYDFDKEKNSIEYSELENLDKWALYQLQRLIEKCLDAYEQFEFYRVFHQVYNFCVVTLSAFYLDIVKDRLYCDGKDSKSRRAVQTVLYETCDTLAKLLAPILSFTAEEIFRYLSTGKTSIFLETMPKVNYDYLNHELANEFDKIIQIRDEVLKALEKSRKEKLIGHSLDAKVIISLPNDSEFNNVINKYQTQLTNIFIVSQVEIVDKLENDTITSESIPGLKIKVEKAAGNKCSRCWNYSITVGTDSQYPDICSRCVSVIKSSVFSFKNNCNEQ